MSTTLSSLRANVQARARRERLKNKEVKGTPVTQLTSPEAGLISQRKLSEILNAVPKPSKRHLKEIKEQPQRPPCRSQQPNFDHCHGSNLVVQAPSNGSSADVLDSGKIEKTIGELIERNKGKLSQSQLVDLIASFYFVTNQYFPASGNVTTVPENTYADDTALRESISSTPNPEKSIPISTNGSFTTEADNGAETTPISVQQSAQHSSYSLRERKQLQWTHEREELEGLNSATSAFAGAIGDNDTCRPQTTMQPENSLTTPDAIRQVREDGTAQSTTPARMFSRFQRRTFEGLSIGVESGDTTTDKVVASSVPPENVEVAGASCNTANSTGATGVTWERQRLEWIAGLDRQVEERRTARERERQLNNEEEVRPSFVTPIGCHREQWTPSDPSKPDAGSQTPMPPKIEVNYARGKGLADLLGRQNADVEVKRRLQLEMQERQRREWVADLDRQVEERRTTREQERQLSNDKEGRPTSVTPVREQWALSDDCKPAAGSQTLMPVKNEVNYGRGKGLADLLGRQNGDVAVKRRQQLEMQAAYAEQMREKEAQRRLEREREAREEAAMAARVEAERVQMMQEKEAEEMRRLKVEAARQAAFVEAQVQAQQRAAKTAVLSSTSSRQPSRVNACRPNSSNTSSGQHADILRVHHKPCRESSVGINVSQPAGINSRPPKSTLNGTYDLDNRAKQPLSDSSSQRRRASFRWKSPLSEDNQDLIDTSGVHVIHTESSLIQKSLAPVPQAKAASDFMSAIADPDFAHPDKIVPPPPGTGRPPKTATSSALEQVTRIKQNLALRQSELQSMQRGVDQCDRG